MADSQSLRDQSEIRPGLLGLEVVVNGFPVEVVQTSTEPVGTIVQLALTEAKQGGQPAAAWELRDSSGNLLDLERPCLDFHLQRLWLNVRAGVGA